MKSSVLSQFDMTYLPVIACLIFAIVFVAMLVWVFRPESKNVYHKAERLPLELGENNE